MTIEELLVYGKQFVHSDHAKLLLSELLEKNQLELYNFLEETVDKNICDKYMKQVEELRDGKPLQYVIGNVNFYGNKFEINENVLIPRFETEELVEKTIYYINKFFTEPVDIIDLGCGSGVIGLSLEKKVSTKTVDLIDISSEAIKVAENNRNKLSLNANLIQSDMWENVDKKYDVIMSNPPYIKTNEEIEDIVKNNEPHLALYAGEDGLDCYKKIFKDIKNHMKEKCLIGLEIGYQQAEDIKKIINENLEDVTIEVVKDMSDKDRMIFVFKNLNK